MFRIVSLAIPLCGAVALLSAACATQTPPAPKSTADEYAAWPQDAAERPAVNNQLGSPMPASRSDRDSSGLVIDERITAACGTIPTARFEFDSDEIIGGAANALNNLSDCFAANGPLAGRRLRIVGFTDPRGETNYNLVLGQKRATAVAFYLSARGFDMINAHTMTEGASKAVGTDDDSWSLDRKVVISLDEETPVTGL